MTKKQATPAVPLLIIKQEYFDEILSGKKTEEYRSLSEHYFRMFCEKDKEGVYDTMKPIGKIKLAVGYSKTRKVLTIEVKDLYVCQFMDEIPEGMNKGDECFVIELGEVLEKNF